MALDSGPITLRASLRDQFKTAAVGNIFLANNFTIEVSIEGCEGTGDFSPIILGESGIASFDNITLKGKQNDVCEIQFHVRSSPLEVSLQVLDSSIILFGCSGDKVVLQQADFDDCQAGGIDILETLVLITIFLFFILVCISIIIVGYLQRQKEEKKKGRLQGVLSINEDLITLADILKDPSIPDIAFKTITIVDRIGHGASGLVYSARWSRGNGSVDIAAKELKLGVGEMDQKALKEFLLEIQIMSALSHSKVVRFIGICTPDPKKIYLISELMHLGSLRDLLDSSASFGWDARIKFAIDAAEGVLVSANLPFI